MVRGSSRLSVIHLVADQELAKVSQLVVQLRDRIAQCKQEMSQEFERLTAAKVSMPLRGHLKQH